MKVLKLLFFFCCIPLISNAQSTKEHIKILRDRIDVAVKQLSKSKTDSTAAKLKEIGFELEQFRAYESSAVAIVKKQLEVEIVDLNKEIKKQESTLNDLENKLKAAKAYRTSEIQEVINEIIESNDVKSTRIAELESENAQLVTDYETILEIKSELGRNEEKVKNLQEENKQLKDKMNIFSSAVRAGLSIGFNYFWNNQRDFIVGLDSIATELGDGRGMSGIISGVVAVRLTQNNKSHLIINIPLGDFTSSADQAVGLFNNRAAVGLGYAISPFVNTPHLAFTGIFNISPYQKIDPNLIRDFKFNDPYFTKLDPDRYGATSEVSYSFTFGIIYSFLNM